MRTETGALVFGSTQAAARSVERSRIGLRGSSVPRRELRLSTLPCFVLARTMRPQSSLPPAMRQLIFGHHIVRFALDAISKTSVRLDRHKLDNGVNRRRGFDLDTSLGPLRGVLNIFIELVCMRHVATSLTCGGPCYVHGGSPERDQSPPVLIPQCQPHTPQALKHGDSSDGGKLRVIPQDV